MAEIKISPLAYVDIFRHCKMYASEDVFIYGLLTGYVEDSIVHVKDYVPLLHYNKPLDFEMFHQLFLEIEQFNDENFDPDFISDEIVGWVRSFPSEIIEPLAADKKNHELIQTAYCPDAIALFIPPSGDQYGMVLKHFQAPLPEIDETTPFEDLDWNFDELEDLDELFLYVLDLQLGKEDNKPIIKENYPKIVPYAMKIT